MLVAVWLQNFGNSTLFCSNAGRVLAGDQRVAFLPLDLRERVAARDREQPANADRRVVVRDRVLELLVGDVDGLHLVCRSHCLTSRGLTASYVLRPGSRGAARVERTAQCKTVVGRSLGPPALGGERAGAPDPTRSGHSFAGSGLGFCAQSRRPRMSSVENIRVGISAVATSSRQLQRAGGGRARDPRRRLAVYHGLIAPIQVKRRSPGQLGDLANVTGEVSTLLDLLGRLTGQGGSRKSSGSCARSTGSFLAKRWYDLVRSLRTCSSLLGLGCRSGLRTTSSPLCAGDRRVVEAPANPASRSSWAISPALRDAAQPRLCPARSRTPSGWTASSATPAARGASGSSPCDRRRRCGHRFAIRDGAMAGGRPASTPPQP